MRRTTIAALAVSVGLIFTPPVFAQGGGGGGGGGAGGGTGGTAGGAAGTNGANGANGTGGGGAGAAGAQGAATPDSASKANISNGSVSGSVDTAHPSRSLPTTDAGGGPERTTALNGRVFRGVFKAEGGSTMTGLATMVPGQTMGTTVVTLNVTGGTAGDYNWHVHVGRCSSPGGSIVGDKSAYPELHVDNSGHATVRATLSAQPPSGGNYYVAIHPPHGGEKQIQACANLLEAGV